MAYIPNLKAAVSVRSKQKAPNQNDIRDPFYHTNTWRKTSENKRIQDPYCVHCLSQGISTYGKVVDHIITRSVGGSDYDTRNLQTLCNRCHNIKRQKESQGIIPPYVYNYEGHKIPKP